MGRGARVGAAVVVAGMSLAGPLVGVAAADTGEADGASVSAGAGDGRGGAQQAGRRESRTDRVARAASSAPRGDGVARELAGGVAPRAVAPAQSEGPVVGQSPDSGPGSVGVAGVASSARAVTAVEVVEPVAVEAGVAGAVAVVPAGVAGLQGATAAQVRQSVAGLSSAASGFFDAVSRLVSLVPGGPFSEVLAGALQLVRRGLFNQAPAAAPRVLVGEVLRPMTGQGSAYSTILGGEVAGSLGATDPEGAPLSYALSRAPQFGTVRVDADGSWVYTPDDGAADQADEFAVSVADGGWNILDPFAAPTEVTVGVNAGLLTSSDKRGLIASDWLTVVKETNDYKWIPPVFIPSNGDEPVLLTVVLTTTLGVDGSTSVELVDGIPNEIASGVDAGDRVSIPDETGDNWINYTDKFTPLSWDAFTSAAIDKTPVPVPVILTVTMALDGDMSMGPLIGALGYQVGNLLKPAARILEETKLIADFNDPKSIVEVFTQAKDRIVKQLLPNDGQPSGWDVTGVIAARLAQWVFSLADPDDPVGLGVTALIPVEPGFMQNLQNIFQSAGSDVREQFCVAGNGCPVARVDVLNGGRGYYMPPEVTFEGGGDPTVKATASAEVVVRDLLDDVKNFVSAVRVTDGGKGYSTRPTVVFDGPGPGASGAYAEAFLGGTVIDLNEQYLGVFPFEIRESIWDADVEARFGFLVPPGDLPGGKAPSWTTTYAGAYVENSRAEWKVETQAWPRITW